MSKIFLNKIFLLLVFFKIFYNLDMIFSILYDLILTCITIVSLPRILYQYFRKKKYKKSFFKRFGYQFPEVDKNNKPLIWVHAVSVGETRAIVNLCKELKDEYTLLISSVTETGHGEALRSLPFANYHVYLPFDFKFVIQPIVEKVRPDVVILSETDLWFHFLQSAKNIQAKILVVNAKISEKSLKRLQKFEFFSKRLFSFVDFFAVQDEIYRKRFLSLKIPESKLFLTGNLKFDQNDLGLDEKLLKLFKDRLGIKHQDKIIVFGSTHDPEESLILDIFEKMCLKYPLLKFILVPRHPERFNIVEKEILKRKIPYDRFSKVETCKERLLLIDQMGMLRDCYQVATIAVVAGSFTEKVGGHNILEPLFYGVPVVFGPFMHSQLELLNLVKTSFAGIQVDQDSLEPVLERLLENPEECRALSEQGLKLISGVNGSTKRTLEVFQKLFLK